MQVLFLFFSLLFLVQSVEGENGFLHIVLI